VLQDGALPGMKFDGEKDFACTRELVDDAKIRVPHGAARFSYKAVTAFLRKQGCTPAKRFHISDEMRGWKFPPLAKMRQEWEARYGGWLWRDDKWECRRSVGF
jgi:hypothetical protein